MGTGRLEGGVLWIAWLCMSHLHHWCGIDHKYVLCFVSTYFILTEKVVFMYFNIHVYVVCI